MTTGEGDGPGPPDGHLMRKTRSGVQLRDTEAVEPAATGGNGPSLGAIATALVVAAGCTALLARPALLPDGRDPTGRLVVLFVVLGGVGLAWPLAGPERAKVVTAAAPLGLGLAAFTVGRFVTGGPAAAHPLFAKAVVLNALAAVAEEAFFRRLVYGALERHGPSVAVAGSAVAFAAVHVTVWGFWVLPLDLAAGLLLSWQRAASGRWWVAALTHVYANALALL